jgi:hypothetical protein
LLQEHNAKIGTKGLSDRSTQPITNNCMLNRSLILKLWLVVIVLAKTLPINSPAYGQIIQPILQRPEFFQERMRQQQEEQNQQIQEQLKETWLRLNLKDPPLLQQQEFTQQRQELIRQQKFRLQQQEIRLQQQDFTRQQQLRIQDQQLRQNQQIRQQQEFRLQQQRRQQQLRQEQNNL